MYYIKKIEHLVECVEHEEVEGVEVFMAVQFEPAPRIQPPLTEVW